MKEKQSHLHPSSFILPPSSERADYAREEQREYERADDEAVAYEDARRVSAKEAQEEPDGGVTDNGRDHRRDEELRAVSMREFMHGLLEFEQPARSHRRYREQEREARGRLAPLAREEAAHDGRARAARARYERQDLREADHERVF